MPWLWSCIASVAINAKTMKYVNVENRANDLYHYKGSRYERTWCVYVCYCMLRTSLDHTLADEMQTNCRVRILKYSCDDASHNQSTTIDCNWYAHRIAICRTMCECPDTRIYISVNYIRNPKANAKLQRDVPHHSAHENNAAQQIDAAHVFQCAYFCSSSSIASTTFLGFFLSDKASALSTMVFAFCPFGDGSWRKWMQLNYKLYTQLILPTILALIFLMLKERTLFLTLKSVLEFPSLNTAQWHKAVIANV